MAEKMGFTGIYWDIMVNFRVNLSQFMEFYLLFNLPSDPSHFSRGAVLTSSHRDRWDLDRELLNLCAAWLVTTVTVLLVSELLQSHLECQKAGIGSGQKKVSWTMIEVGSLIEV